MHGALRGRLTSALQAFWEDQQQAASIDLLEDPGWKAMGDAILAARVTLSSFKLMQAFCDVVRTKPELRALTREHVEEQNSKGIEHDMFPKLLLSRMKVALRMENMS